MSQRVNIWLISNVLSVSLFFIGHKCNPSNCAWQSDVTWASWRLKLSNLCSTFCSSRQQIKYPSSVSLDLCEGKPPVTGGFSSQRAFNAKNAKSFFYVVASSFEQPLIFIALVLCLFYSLVISYYSLHWSLSVMHTYTCICVILNWTVNYTYLWCLDTYM